MFFYLSCWFVGALRQIQQYLLLDVELIWTTLQQYHISYEVYNTIQQYIRLYFDVLYVEI